MLESGLQAGLNSLIELVVNGTAAADLAIAKYVYDECKRMGRGIALELPVPGEQ